MSIFSSVKGFGFGQSLFQGAAGPTLTADVVINKNTPGVVLQGTEQNARQCEVREQGGYIYIVNNATWNGAAWVCVNTALEADGERISSVGLREKITANATTGNISWNTVQKVDNQGNTTFGTTSTVVIATIGPATAQQHTLPAVASDTIALLAATQTLSSKTLASPSISTQMTLVQTTANYTVKWANPASAHNLTIPDPTADDTFVFLGANQTLTNKTLSGPLFTGAPPQVSGANRFRMLQSMARSHQGTSQTISNGTFTALAMNSNDFNTDNMWTSSANTKLVAQIAGKYLITSGVIMLTFTGQYQANLRKNGSDIAIATQQAPGTFAPVLNVSAIAQFSAQDYVELYVFQGSGGNVDTILGQATFLAMTYLGE